MKNEELLKGINELSDRDFYGLLVQIFGDRKFGYEDACDEWGNPSDTAKLCVIKKILE